MHSPLNALRLPSLNDAGLSGSWQPGSPLPRPMTRPGPSTRNVISLPAVGTRWSRASTISTATVERSSPSAAICKRSGRRTTLAGAPMVSLFQLARPSLFLNRALRARRADTSHSIRCKSCGLLRAVPMFFVLGMAKARNHRACFFFPAIVFHFGLNGDLRACFLNL